MIAADRTVGLGELGGSVLHAGTANLLAKAVSLQPFKDHKPFATLRKTLRDVRTYRGPIRPERHD
jgi:hypothetical protein